MKFRAAISGPMPGRSMQDYLSLPDPPSSQNVNDPDYIPDLSKGEAIPASWYNPTPSIPPDFFTQGSQSRIWDKAAQRKAASYLPTDTMTVTPPDLPSPWWLLIPVALIGAVALSRV